MLDGVIDYLPAPTDVPPIVGHKADNEEEEEIEVRADDDAPLRRAFKVMTHMLVV